MAQFIQQLSDIENELTDLKAQGSRLEEANGALTALVNNIQIQIDENVLPRVKKLEDANRVQNEFNKDILQKYEGVEEMTTAIVQNVVKTEVDMAACLSERA